MHKNFDLYKKNTITLEEKKYFLYLKVYTYIVQI